MNIKLVVSIIFLASILTLAIAKQSIMQTNDELPYYEIPDYPDKYTNVNVVARMIDGLGYRYYWATEGLRAEDLAYKPSEDSRAVSETLDHLYGLSEMIVNAPSQLPNLRPRETVEMTFEEKRAKTLQNFKTASNILKESKRKDLEKYAIVFQRGEEQSTVPFWNLLNGPIADAIYHTGQIVAFRRAAGNPMDAGVNVFMGKTRK